MASDIRWTHDDMISAYIEWLEDDEFSDPEDFEVIRTNDGVDPCLVVCHVPTGRTSDECGDAGRFTLDGRLFSDARA